MVSKAAGAAIRGRGFAVRGFAVRGFAVRRSRFEGSA
jgi:hypothetical protein